MKRLMVLGACQSQVSTIMKAKEMGLEVIVVDKDPLAVGLQYADTCLTTSVKNTDYLVSKAKELDIDGVIAPCGDTGTHTAGVIVNALGLPGINNLATQSINDKRVAYHVLQREGILTPRRYCTIDADYPLIVKPYDGVASRGVYKINSKEDMPEFMDNNVMEEYIEGELVSVSCLIQDGLLIAHEVVDQMLSTNNFGTCMFTHPSTYYSTPLMMQISKTCIRVINAFSIKNGVIEIECIVKDDQVYVIDINPRMTGGHLFDAFSIASKRDWIECAIKIAIGEELPLFVSYCRSFVLALVGSKVEGTIKGIEIPKGLFSKYKFISFWKSCGDQVKSVLTKETSSDQTIYVIYTDGDDKYECIHNLRKAIDKIKVIVE